LRLKEASTALMARTQISNGKWSLDARADSRPPLPSVESIVYALRDAQGRLLLGDGRLPVVSLDSDISQLFALSQFDRRYLRTLSTRFDTPVGTVIVTVADTRAVEPVARLSFMNTLMWDFVQLDITLVLAWAGIQFGLRPMKRLRDDISKRSPLDLRPIEESSVPREIAPVVVTLNRLFALLRDSVQSQQQFISNTAHQLRTPITGMQAQLDLLIAEEAAQPVKDRLLVLQESIRRLAHSSNQLLALARAEPTANIVARKRTVELDIIIGEVVAKFFDRALRSDIDLGIDVQPVSLKGDSSLLDDLISNLIDNALNYTPAGGTVTVSAGHIDGHPFLAVEDTGPGIPPDERQRVRQRFYRMPNSPGHGSGLGLAIVDEIARVHDATLEIGPGPGGIGARFLLRFP
jgi:two-component system sensor histidine kinase TctE